MEFLPFILALGGSLLAAWATIKYVITTEMRIDANLFKTLYKSNHNGRVFVLTEDFLTENRYPLEFFAFYYLKDCPWFLLSHSERLLTAGWQGKDYISKVLCLRWQTKKCSLLKIPGNTEKNMQIGPENWDSK